MLERWALQNSSFFPASTVLRFPDSNYYILKKSPRFKLKKKRQGSQFRRTVLAPWIRLQEYFLVHVLWLKGAEVKKLRFLHAKLWGTTAAGGGGGSKQAIQEVPVGLTPTRVQRNGTKSQAPFDLTPWSGVPTDWWLWPPVVLRVYKRRKGVGGTDDEVHRDLTLSLTSLSGPITKAQRRRKSSTLQRYCFGSPAPIGSGAVRPPRANAPRIYFHFTD
jgi:hypothetical protein